MPERDLHELVLPGSVPVDESHLDLGRQLQANVGADLGSADAQASQQSQQFLVREGGEAVVGHQATLGEAEALRDFLDEKGLRPPHAAGECVTCDYIREQLRAATVR